jgi:hypothetical protein
VPTRSPSTTPPRVLSPAERGLNGARKRWGAPRVLKMHDLAPDQRRVLMDLAQTFRAANHNHGRSAKGGTR